MAILQRMLSVNTPTTATSRKYLEGIEALRAFAAMAIVIFHIIHINGINPPDYLQFLKWNTGYGVPLFFCISAFSLAYGYAGRLENKHEITGFYVRRFARIAPLFYACLIFMIFYYYFVDHGTYRLTDLLLNISFLFNLTPSTIDGIVPASWSIGVEMLFYLVLPILLLFCRNFWATVCVGGITLLVAVKYGLALAPYQEQLGPFIWHSLIYNMPYFMWGLAAYYAYIWLQKKATPIWLGYAVTFGSLLALTLLYQITPKIFAYFVNNNIRVLYDTFWGIGFAVLCLGMALGNGTWRVQPFTNIITTFLGRISFSLYLAHPHIITALKSVAAFEWLTTWFNPAGAPYLAATFIMVCVPLIPVAYLLYRFIEVPGMAWGRRLHSKLST